MDWGLSFDREGMSITPGGLTGMYRSGGQWLYNIERVKYKSFTETGCGAIERETNYPGVDIGHVDNVLSAEECSEICANHDGCQSWTYGRKNGKFPPGNGGRSGEWFTR